MKREVNNSRVNLEANNASTISNKPKPNKNPSTVTVNPPQSRNIVPPSMNSNV